MGFVVGLGQATPGGSPFLLSTVVNDCIFQISGVLPGGYHLPGRYEWPSRVRLGRVRVIGSRPVGGEQVLRLEVGGVATGAVVLLPAAVPGSTALDVTVELGVEVAAGVEVRWLSEFAGAAEDAVFGVCLVMEVGEPVVERPALTLEWVDGVERRVLFRYDSETHVFTEVLPGSSENLVFLQQVGDSAIVVYVCDVAALWVVDGVFRVLELDTVSPAAGLSPRLCFCVGGEVVAALTQWDFRVSEAAEGTVGGLTAADNGYWSRFEFWSGGVLTATLDRSGLVALEIGEGAS